MKISLPDEKIIITKPVNSSKADIFELLNDDKYVPKEEESSDDEY